MKKLPSARFRLLRLAVGALALGVAAPGAVGRQGQAPARELFREVAQQAISAQRRAVLAGPEILRQGFVRVDLDLLGGPDWGQGVPPRAGSSLHVNLFPDVTLMASLQRVRPNPIGNYSWQGVVMDDPDGYVDFVVGGGMMAGGVRTAGKYYRIGHAGDGIHHISEIDPSWPVQQQDDDAIIAAETEPGTMDPAAFEAALITIDVLGVYNAAASAGALGGIANEFQQAIDDANVALAATGILATLNLVALHETDYDGGFTEAVGLLQGRGDGTMDEVHTLRAAYGADLVALILEMGDATATGRGYVPPAGGRADLGFSITVRRYASLPFYILAHEIGHNLGGHHDLYMTSEPGAFSYSHGYVDLDKRFVTVMAYQNQCANAGVGCVTERFFSSPKWTHLGVPIGAGGADNTRTFHNMVGVIAGYSSPAPGPSPPGIPRVLRVSVNVNSATLSWAAPDAGGVVDDYWVEVGSAPGESDVVDAPTRGTEYVTAPLAAGRYYARVYARNANGVSAPSGEARFAVQQQGPLAPATPRNLRSAVSGGRVTLDWDPPDGNSAAADYVVQVGPTPGSAGFFNATTGATQYQLDAVPVGEYYAQVAARNQYGTSDFSNQIQFNVELQSEQAPDLPSNLRGTVAGRDLTLRWDPPASGATPADYAVHVGTSPGSANYIKVPTTATRFDLRSLDPGTYYSRVLARNRYGSSDFSNSVRFVIEGDAAGAPGPPRNLRVSGITRDTVEIDWQSPATGDAPTYYVVELGTASGAADYAVLEEYISRSMTLHLPQGTYYARVRAGTATGLGTPTPERRIVVLHAGLEPPAPIRPVGRTNQPIPGLQWYPSTNADYFEVIVADATGQELFNRGYGTRNCFEGAIAPPRLDTWCQTIQPSELPAPLADGRYKLSIRSRSTAAASDWVSADFVIDANGRARKPKLRSPRQGETIAAGQRLSWLPHAYSNEFKLELTGAAGKREYLLPTLQYCDADQCGVAFGRALQAGTWRWRVAARKDQAGAWLASRWKRFEVR